MFVALNDEGSCTIPVTEATTIYLKVFPPSIDPPLVHDHDVPILTISKEDMDLTDWDLTTQQVEFRLNFTVIYRRHDFVRRKSSRQ